MRCRQPGPFKIPVCPICWPPERWSAKLERGEPLATARNGGCGLCGRRHVTEWGGQLGSARRSAARSQEPRSRRGSAASVLVGAARKSAARARARPQMRRSDRACAFACVCDRAAGNLHCNMGLTCTGPGQAVPLLQHELLLRVDPPELTTRAPVLPPPPGYEYFRVNTGLTMWGCQSSRRGQFHMHGTGRQMRSDRC